MLLDCLAIARADKLMTLEMERKHLSSTSDEKPLDVSDKTLSVILKKKVSVKKSFFLLDNDVLIKKKQLDYRKVQSIAKELCGENMQARERV